MSVWLLVLLGIDLAFMGAHLISVWATDAGMTSRWLVSYRWRVTQDLGFAEIFQYGQTLLAMGLLLRLAAAARWRSAVAWTVVLLYVVADDSLSVHEAGGHWLVSHLGLRHVAGLSGQDLGEMGVWALVGLLLLPLLLWALWHDRSAGRRLFAEMSGLFALFALAGGGLDAVHSMVHDVPVLGTVLSLGEDGGEMVVMSVIVARLWWFSEGRGLRVPAPWPWTWRTDRVDSRDEVAAAGTARGSLSD